MQVRSEKWTLIVGQLHDNHPSRIMSIYDLHNHAPFLCPWQSQGKALESTRSAQILLNIAHKVEMKSWESKPDIAHSDCALQSACWNQYTWALGCIKLWISLSLSRCNIPGTRNDMYNIERINFLQQFYCWHQMKVQTRSTPITLKNVSANRQIHNHPNAQHCRRQQCTALLVTTVCYVIINNNKQIVSFKIAWSSEQARQNWFIRT